MSGVVDSCRFFVSCGSSCSFEGMMLWLSVGNFVVCRVERMQCSNDLDNQPLTEPNPSE